MKKRKRYDKRTTKMKTIIIVHGKKKRLHRVLTQLNINIIPKALIHFINVIVCTLFLFLRLSCTTHSRRYQIRVHLIFLELFKLLLLLHRLPEQTHLPNVCTKTEIITQRVNRASISHSSLVRYQINFHSTPQFRKHEHLMFKMNKLHV